MPRPPPFSPAISRCRRASSLRPSRAYARDVAAGRRASATCTPGASALTSPAMCTLVFGLDVLGPHSVLIATNRDEDPARRSEPPQVLSREPLVVGGRDAIAGGTWLEIGRAHV